MKSLEERKQARKERAEEAIRPAFDNAEFLHQGRQTGENKPGEDTSKGTSSGTPASASNPGDVGRTTGEAQKGEGGDVPRNDGETTKVSGDATKARQREEAAKGGTGWGSRGQEAGAKQGANPDKT